MRGEDTIAAIATGMGEGGIGVVRISGPEGLAVGERSFAPKSGRPLGSRRSHSVTFGWVVDANGRRVDEALGIVMRGPRSFTGEDTVELHCHGGQVAVRQVLDAVLQAGARLAEPGEFTRRAFLNGRLDLSQAESVIEIIRAKTDRAMRAAMNQLRGELSQEVRTVRDRLLESIAHLEADIDFPELNLQVQTQGEVTRACTESLGKLHALVSGARRGKLLREGLRVVLAGRPNVGKSSLMNRLLRENRAIVTEVPGTTRDVIEEWVSIKGLPVILADTAGIRATQDVVERLGVDRSRAMLEQADLVLVVVDMAEGIHEEDLAVRRLIAEGKAWQVVLNKADLVDTVDLEKFQSVFNDAPVITVSAASGTGLDDLEEAIVHAAGAHDVEESFIANSRHEEALRTAVGYLEAAMRTQAAGFSSDLVAIDIRSAWTVLGEITGDTVGEDILDQIFSRFCIGK